MPRHKVDRLGSHVLRGQRQVALILAVLVVDHDNHPPRVDLLHRPRHIRHDPRIVHSPILRQIHDPGHAPFAPRMTDVIAPPPAPFKPPPSSPAPYTVDRRAVHRTWDQPAATAATPPRHRRPSPANRK